MIHITQGHESSISTEVLIKSLKKFSQKSLDKCTLHFSKKSLIENLTFLDTEHNLKNNMLCLPEGNINVNYLIENNQNSESLSSLKQALAKLTNKDILITMPTSKDQLCDGNLHYNGHTDFFRKNINKDATMLFKYKSTYSLLLSDHIPISEVNSISSKSFENKLKSSLDTLKKTFNFNGEIYIAGMNPHAGEDGMIGKEELLLKKSLEEITSIHHFENNNFIPADTIHYLYKKNKEQLFIYFYHDQALTFFKHAFGLFGINITLNLPFLRFSVDHGTAFNLYSKNSANFLGTYYVLNEAFKIHG